MLKDLVSRSDLNQRAARVLDKSWTEAAQHPGRVPVEMVVGKEPMWVKLDNLAGPILDPADMTAPPYDAMTPEERTEASLRMLEPPKPAPAPVAEASPEASPEPQDMRNLGSDWTQRRCESAGLFMTYLPPKGCTPEQTLGLPKPAGPYRKGTLSLWKYNLDPHTADLVWIPDGDETPRWHAVRLDLVDLRCVGLSRSDEDTICMSFTNEHGRGSKYYWFTFNEVKAVYFLKTLRELNASRAPMPPRLRPNEPVNLFQDIHESVEAPAPAPAPAAAAIPSSDHENPWDFSDFSDSEDEPAPAPAPDRRDAALERLRDMMKEHCPEPHYCIYCGSEGLHGDKCMPCGFYRGTFPFPPKGGDTFMGRKLAYVGWPWQGDPEAPYVRASEPEPEPPKPFGPNQSALNDLRIAFETHVVAKLSNHEAKKLNITINDLLTKERLPFWHIMDGTQIRMAVMFTDDGLAFRDKKGALHLLEAGRISDGSVRPELAAQRLYHYLRLGNSNWYPDPDADEEDVDAYLEAKIAALDADAAPAPAPAPAPAFAPTNPNPERKDHPWAVAAFFEQLLKELPHYHREEMAEIVKCETIKDFEVGEVIDGRNRYEKSLTVSLTRTPCEDSDDESEHEGEGDDTDRADRLYTDRLYNQDFTPDFTTKTITLKTYITPYDDNNAGVWLVDETGYEHELASVGTIPCPGGEPVRSFNKANAARCAQYGVAYLVYGRRYWKGH